MAAGREHIRFSCIEQLVLLKLLPQKAGKRSCTKTAIKQRRQDYFPIWNAFIVSDKSVLTALSDRC